MPHCSICNHSVPAWTPHSEIASRSEFSKLIGAVGSDLSVYQCPACGCNDRDRHLWLYLQAIELLPKVPEFNILHMAPEVHIEQLLQSLSPSRYVRGDLYPQRPGHERLDLQALPFDDASFNLIICNHVLEHVADPDLAIAELYRCLVPDGILVAQTPYAPLLKNTLEATRPVTPAFAKLFYGQEDHVRMFGADIGSYFQRAGFKGDPLQHSLVLPAVDAASAGVNAQEPFFVFSK